MFSSNTAATEDRAWLTEASVAAKQALKYLGVRSPEHFVLAHAETRKADPRGWGWLAGEPPVHKGPQGSPSAARGGPCEVTVQHLDPENLGWEPW